MTTLAPGDRVRWETLHCRTTSPRDKEGRIEFILAPGAERFPLHYERMLLEKKIKDRTGRFTHASKKEESALIIETDKFGEHSLHWVACSRLTLI